MKTKIISASETARTALNSQLANLVKRTENACAKSKKTGKASQKAMKTAKQDEKIADKEMKKEQKKASSSVSSSDPANPLIKKEWKVVTQGKVITASIDGTFNQTAVLEAEKAKSKPKSAEEKQRDRLDELVLLDIHDVPMSDDIKQLYPNTYPSNSTSNNSTQLGNSSISFLSPAELERKHREAQDKAGRPTQAVH